MNIDSLERPELTLNCGSRELAKWLSSVSSILYDPVGTPSNTGARLHITKHMLTLMYLLRPPS